MADYVLELKPQSVQPQFRHNIPSNGDFVAEIRGRPQAPSYSDISGMDVDDIHLEKILANGQFSRQRIESMLHGSILTLVEKLLTGKLIAEIRGGLQVILHDDQTPIAVDFQKTYPSPIRAKLTLERSFDNCLNIKIKDRDLPPQMSISPPCEMSPGVGAFSPPSSFDRDMCHSPPQTQTGLSALPESNPETQQLNPEPVDVLQIPVTGHGRRHSSTDFLDEHPPVLPCEDSLFPPRYDTPLTPPTLDVPRSKHYLSPTNQNSFLKSVNNRSSIPFQANSTSSYSPNTSSPPLGQNVPSPFSNYSSEAKLSLLESHPVIQPGLATLPMDNKKVAHSSTDSDGESGYTSNCMEEATTPNSLVTDANSQSRSPSPRNPRSYNDYFCSGFDGKNTVYDSADSSSNESSISRLETDYFGSSEDGSDDMDEDESEEDAGSQGRLVIDESQLQEVIVKTNDLTKRSENCRTDTCQMNRLISGCSQGELEMQAASCDEDEADDVDELVVADADKADPFAVSDAVTDTDSHAGPCRNTGLHSESESITPHPRSMVSICKGGYRCKECLHLLTDITDVAAHVLARHDVHCCTYCCRTFTAKNNLKRHIRRHTGQKPYKCLQCPQSFFRRDDLKGHMLRHDYSKPFRCSVCQKGYTDRACVKNHMVKEHGSRLLHVCPQCGESFDKEDEFSLHKRSHPELQQFACSTCSFIGTNNLMIQKHVLLHTHRLFSCKPCNAYFADPFDYTSHIRKHKKTPSFSQYVCCFCEVNLSTYEQFVRHEYSHAQGKTHTCLTCKRPFRSKSHLLEHSLTHRTEVDHDESSHEQENTQEAMETETSPCNNQDSTHSLEADTRNKTESNILSGAKKLIPSYQHTESHSQMIQETDEYDGQLLDLSMKKPSPGIANTESSGEVQQQENLHSSLGTSGISVLNSLRNDAVCAKPVDLSRECEVEVKEPAHRDEQDENLCLLTSAWRQKFHLDSGVLKSRVLQRDIPDSAPTVTQKMNFSKYRIPLRSNSLDATTNSYDVNNLVSDRKTWARSLLNNANGKLSLRFSPYYREKMADFAAKFVATRGPKIAQTAVPKLLVSPDTGTGLTRKETSNIPSLISNQQRSYLEETKLKLDRTDRFLGNGNTGDNRRTDRVLHHESTGDNRRTDRFFGHDSTGEILSTGRFLDHDDGSCERSNPETALRSHIPTVVKSESQPEHESAADTLELRLQKLYKAGKTTSSPTKKDFVRPTGGYNCELCEQDFDCFPSLEHHSVETHKRYLCEHCGKSFTARPNRDRHVRYHTGERPYQCDLCDLAFFRGDDLKYHRTTRHPTAQPFVCVHCSATFTWGRDLERHIRHSKCKM